MAPPPSNPTQHDDSTTHSIIRRLSREENYNVITRIYATGSGLGDGRLTLQHANISLPTGYDWVTNANGHKIGIKNTLLETSNSIQIEQEKTWSQIQPAADSFEAIETAANALANTALNHLKKVSTTEYIYSVQCILHDNVRPGNTIELNYTDPGQNATSMVHTGGSALYIQSVRHQCGRDGVRYTTLHLTESLLAESKNSSNVVADNIQQTKAIQRHASSGINTTSGGGAPVNDHGALTGLGDDDHTIYLLADGSRDLSDDLAVAAGKTIDGVDLSAHAINPNAHHAQSHFLVGGDHSASGLTVGEVLKATGATSFDFQTLLHSELGGVGTDDHHPQVHGITSSNHTVTGSNFDLVGLIADDTLGILTPSSNPGVSQKILATNASGGLQLQWLGINTAPATSGANVLRINGDIEFRDGDGWLEANSGNIFIEPSGDLYLNPGGNDVLPFSNYDIILGAPLRKYLKLYVAELEADQLVAQDVIATIGGRIIVAPTTTLINDIITTDTTITVAHNEMVSGDRIWMEARLQVEFMAVTSNGVANGSNWDYTVTRNLDGSGANSWISGDAIVNTGQTGDGYIDIYALGGLGTAGPTIAGVIRQSATYNDLAESWALGNLNGLYGYGNDTPGVGLGEYDANASHITIDSTNGIRMFDGLSTVVGHWEPGGDLTLGEVATNQANLFWDQSAGRVNLRGGTNGTVVGLYLDSDGTLTAGAGSVLINELGIRLLGESSAGAGAIHWDDDTNNHDAYIWYQQDPTDPELHIENEKGSNDAKIILDAGLTKLEITDDTTNGAGFFLSNFGTSLIAVISGHTTSANDHIWLRTETVSVEQGLAVGGLAINIGGNPSQGDIRYTGKLQSRKNSTQYNVYGFHPLTTQLSSTAWMEIQKVQQTMELLIYQQSLLPPLVLRQF